MIMGMSKKEMRVIIEAQASQIKDLWGIVTELRRQAVDCCSDKSRSSEEISKLKEELAKWKKISEKQQEANERLNREAFRLIYSRTDSRDVILKENELLRGQAQEYFKNSEALERSKEEYSITRRALNLACKRLVDHLPDDMNPFSPAAYWEHWVRAFLDEAKAKTPYLGMPSEGEKIPNRHTIPNYNPLYRALKERSLHSPILSSCLSLYDREIMSQESLIILIVDSLLRQNKKLTQEMIKLHQTQAYPYIGL